MGLPTKEQLVALQAKGDPDTDDRVKALLREHGEEAVGDLLEVLMRWTPGEPFPPPNCGVTAKQALVDFAWTYVNQPPFQGAMNGKVDWAKVLRAQKFYDRHQNTGLMILGCGSLPACYSIPGVAGVLMGSGKLSLHVRGRLEETIAYLKEVMKPGTLGEAPGLTGNLWVRKVRLMHGIMRGLILADPAKFNHLPADRASRVLMKRPWGQPKDYPIDQVELGFVLLTFSWMVVRGFRKMNIWTSGSRADDHVYAWAVIGYGLGVEEIMRPDNASEAEALFELIRDEYEEGTEDGRLLVAALVYYIIMRLRQGVREKLPPWLLKILVTCFKRAGAATLESLSRTLVRLLTGKDTANKLWVPRAPGIHWLAGLGVRFYLWYLDLKNAGDGGVANVLSREFEKTRARPFHQ